MRSHGTRACYVHGPGPGSTPGGCRCGPCRQAATEAQRQFRNRKAPPYVDATEVRDHLAMLSKAGVGLKQITRLTGVSGGQLNSILYGRPRHDGTRRPPQARVRPETRDRILAVMPSDQADGAPVPAGPIWEIIDQLVTRGWTKSEVARRIGQTPPLQLGRQSVTARHARTIRGLLDEPVPPRRSRHGLHPVPQPEPEPAPAGQQSSGDRSLAALFGRRVPLPTEILERGACRADDVPTWLFFADERDTKSITAAKAICASCPVSAECLTYSLSVGEYGIWGGTTEGDRHEIVAQRNGDRYLGDQRHGTYYAYRLGCRCQPCRDRVARGSLESRRKRKAS